MAVTKLWKVSVRLGQVLDYTTNPEKTANPEYSAEDYQALKDVLAYAKDEEKTEHEFFCDGINCNVAMARDQFIQMGNVIECYYHILFSFYLLTDIHMNWLVCVYPAVLSIKFVGAGAFHPSWRPKWLG